MTTFDSQSHPRGHVSNPGSFSDKTHSAPEASLETFHSSWEIATSSAQVEMLDRAAGFFDNTPYLFTEWEGSMSAVYVDDDFEVIRMHVDAHGGLTRLEVLQTSEEYDSWVDIEGGDLWEQLSEVGTIEPTGDAYTRPLTRAQSEAVDVFNDRFGPTSVRPVDAGGFEALAIAQTDLYRLQLDAEAAGAYEYLNTNGSSDSWSAVEEEN